jgi:heme/copper-type cytochrome/quinol oxidase subunit 3
VIAPAAAEERAERAADVGGWLFLASLVMFVASLVSGYVLLRAGSDAWPTPWRGQGLADPWFRLIWLVVAAGTARAAVRDTPFGPAWMTRYPLQIAAVAGTMFWLGTLTAAQDLMGGGHGPSSHVAPAAWFALNGVVAMLALGGAAASIAVAIAPDPARKRRARALARYWMLVAIAFAVIVVGMYLL